MLNFSKIPIDFCKDIKINSNTINGYFNFPIATFELTLFKSIKRGALLSRYTNGIEVSVSSQTMTRSIILKSDSLKKHLILKMKSKESHQKIPQY